MAGEPGRNVHDVEIVQDVVRFPSQDGKSQINGVIWTGAAPGWQPRAIMQIAHGMTEHIGRYEELARFLVAKGFAVCGNDHVGHGKSVADPSEWGVLPVQKGDKVLVEDCHQMRQIVQERVDGQVPYFFFGHSMGSFVVRAYIAKHAVGLAGAIICGTGHNSKAVCQAGSLLAHVICRNHGDAYYSKTLASMADGAYSKAIKDARTPYDWLNRDPEEVDAYLADEMSGFSFKAGGYATLMDLCSTIADPITFHDTPADLPIYLIAGDKDPVGNNGAGVRTVHEMYKQAGVADLTIKLYPGMRHEVHREFGRAEVLDDLWCWMRDRIGVVDAPQAAAVAAAAGAAGAAGAGAGEKPSFLIALDQGTTSSRCLLIDGAGTVLDSSSQGFEQLYPKPGWVEHDPQAILKSQFFTLTNVVDANALTAADVAAIGITNQRETTIVWNRETGEPIYNAIVWQSRQTADLVERFCSDPEVSARITQKTGLAPDAYFSASKIRWILDEVPGAWEDARAGKLAFGTVDSWLVYNLTGRQVHATDLTNASRTMLFDISTCQWDEWLFGLFDIPLSMAPQVLPSAAEYGRVARGPLAGVPITGVVGDQQAALFGQCCFEEGQAKSTYGTGCFLLMNAGHEPIISRNGLVTTIAASAPGTAGVEYALEGSVYSCAALLQWVCEGLGVAEKPYETEAMARAVQDNAGVYIVPALTGLGAPYWDADARGAILGITRGVTANHIARAALEAIAYQLYDLVEAMEADAGKPMKELYVDGGVSANGFCMQFQSDVLNKRVRRPLNVETTAMGAAYLAGLAVGYWKDLDEIRALRSTDTVFEPAMDDEVRQQVLKGWHEAVGRVLTK